MDNADVARILEDVADLLEIQGENPFRVRAYRRAARTVETLGEPVADLAARGKEALTELPGIGEDLAGKITEIVETGDLTLHTQLAGTLPAGLSEVMRVDSVGPKRAKILHDALGIGSIDALARAARAGRLRGVPGFGETLEARILKGCEQHAARGVRYRLDEADAHAAPLVDYLRSAPEAAACDVAGSYRRRRDTVGDLDVLVASSAPEAIGDHLVKYPGAKEVLARGDTKIVLALRSGIHVDVRVVPPEAYGAALHYFTGSKAHNIHVRTLGIKRGLKINEYGVFRGERRVGGRTEEEVFRAVGLPFIPPELREDRGEIEAAQASSLPALVEPGDIRGDLHMHTTATDGKNTLAEMVGACAARGYSYVAFTDHTRAVRVAGGKGRETFVAQAREIAKAARAAPGLTLLRSAEVDILPDGSLDLDERTLGELDIVTVAVHSKLDMPEQAMTERVLRALRHPRVSILAHPTGRLLGRREPAALDMAKIVRAARDLGVMLEIDAQPARLDLDDVHVRMARDAGVKLVIDSDAHSVTELSFMRLGVDQARRGWCTAGDVANTRPLDAFLALLRTAGARRKAG